VVKGEIARHGERKGSMEGVAATVCIEGVNFECGKMGDRAVCITCIVTTIRSSCNDRRSAPGLREVGARIQRVSGITCPSCKIAWDNQMVDEVSQQESRL
jgi:hypothetical protein